MMHYKVDLNLIRKQLSLEDTKTFLEMKGLFFALKMFFTLCLNVQYTIHIDQDILRIIM